MKEATSYQVYWVTCPYCNEDFELTEEPSCIAVCDHCGEEIDVIE